MGYTARALIIEKTSWLIAPLLQLRSALLKVNLGTLSFLSVARGPAATPDKMMPMAFIGFARQQHEHGTRVTKTLLTHCVFIEAGT